MAVRGPRGGWLGLWGPGGKVGAGGAGLSGKGGGEGLGKRGALQADWVQLAEAPARRGMARCPFYNNRLGLHFT